MAMNSHLPAMKTLLSPAVFLFAVSVATIVAQEPALIGGGSTRPQPVMDYVPPAPAVVNPPAVQHVRIRYEYEASSVPVSALPCTTPRPPCASTYSYPSSYTTYPSYYQGCASPTVIYFGRGEAARRGYHFRHSR
jgi:hypothetical protein